MSSNPVEIVFSARTGFKHGGKTFRLRSTVYADGGGFAPELLRSEPFLQCIRNFRSPLTLEDDYGIIPFPKLDEKQENYMNLLYNSSSVVTIPITCAEHEKVGAVIEAMCAESYRSVVEVFYETALKTKYSRDSYSGQCIDIIRDATRKNLLYEYNAQIGYPSMLITNCVSANNSGLSSAVASTVPSANKIIEKKIAAMEKEKAQ